MYAKLENGQLLQAPNRIVYSNVTVYNPTPEMFMEAGYKPVSFVPLPEPPDGYYYEEGWEERSEEIVQTWALVKLPDDLTDEEALLILLGGDSE